MTDRVRSRLVTASAVCLAAFLGLAALVAVGWQDMSSVDARWSGRAYAFTLDHGWCENLARAATFLGNGWWVTVVTGATALGCAVCRRWRLGWWLVLTVAGSAVLSTLLKVGLKRVRPGNAGILTSAHGFAFPSGHTQAATVTYVAVILVVGWQVFAPNAHWRAWTSVVVSGVIGAVGLSRIFLGAHWPSDVLGGWLLGSAWVMAATVVLLRRPRSPTVDDARASDGGDPAQ